MKAKVLSSGLLVLILTLTAFGMENPITAKSSSINRDLIIANLMNGIHSDNQGLVISSSYFLGELKSDEAVIPLMKILKSDINEEARIMAALSLSKIGDSRGIFAVKQAISFDKSERVKKMCSNFYQDFISKK